ncbi:hypothetical protein C7453_102222 [Gluconacetobacter liquefaciens]|uniref:Uncharacterized protein n=1 Tax=Gluconacetobacter liquefaciens TaxID=89584 RepID=A0A370GAE8_GLULI|nr:hypothetical protein C7453_102222 [Gluconacetobacter liquefaciens]
MPDTGSWKPIVTLYFCKVFTDSNFQLKKLYILPGRAGHTWVQPALYQP